MNFNKIKTALYATLLTNRYGLRLKKAATSAEKKRIRLEYARKLLAALHIDVVVEGREKLPDAGPLLLVTNHRSIIDPLIIEVALEESDLFGLWVSKKELYNSFFFGLFTRNAGTVLLDRESSQMGGFFNEIKANVAKGDSIFLFPEGTRNKEQTDLSPFKEGARIIALKNRLPILPIYIRTNADEVLGSVLKNRRTQQIRVEIGDLIDYKDKSVELEEAYKKRFGLAK